MPRREKGFTLIELTLVVIILSILVALAAPRFVGRAKEARIAAVRVQIEHFGVALDSYELDNGEFPTTEQGLNALRVKPSDASNWNGPYLKKGIPRDPWGNSYHYISPGVHNIDYDLYSYGPDGTEGTEDDIKNWEE